MKVALENLRRDRRRFQTELFADIPFDEWIEMLIGADRAGNLSDRDCGERMTEPADIAARFIIPECEFQPECRRLGMEPVRPADHERVLEFPGAAGQNRLECLQILQQ